MILQHCLASLLCALMNNEMHFLVHPILEKFYKSWEKHLCCKQNSRLRSTVV